MDRDGDSNRETKKRERDRETDGQIERLRGRERELTSSLPQAVKFLG